MAEQGKKDPPLAAEPSDEISVATLETSSKVLANPKVKKEYVLKLQFRPKTATTQQSEIAKTHFAILRAISDIFQSSVVIYDNYGSTMTEFKNPQTFDQYLRHFKMEYIKPNKAKKRDALYVAYHRMHSSVPVSEIRRHHVISQLLSKVKTRMNVHLWQENETRISNLGFSIKVDPTNYLKEDFEESIRVKIATKTKRNIKNIPRFQCGYHSPYVIHEDGTRTATKTYDLQCRQKDAKEMISLLQATYQDDPTFIFHKIRHVNPQIYVSAIRKQNLFLSNLRMIPLQGISADIMFSLEVEILAIRGVTAVLRHKDTATKGRWNIQTTEEYFKPIIAMMETDLKKRVEHFSKEHPMDGSLGPVGLAFRNQLEEEGSDSSFQSYLSACSSVYTLEDTDDFESPPEPARPAPQAWGGTKIPEVFDSPAEATTTSGLTQDDFDKLSRENAKLLRRVDELTAQIQQLLQRQSTTDISVIVAAATQAVLQSMQHREQPTMPPPADVNIPPKRKEPDTPVVQQHDELDMSFDSAPKGQEMINDDE